MTLGTEENFLMKYPCKISIITHTSAMAFSSVITYISVNRQKNVVQHLYWGKIFPFLDDYALQFC